MSSSVTNIRRPYINVFNDVRRKLGVKEISTLGADSLGKAMVDYINDIINEVSDYGDWQEMYKEENFPFTTAQSSVFDWVFDTSANIKNIHEVQFGPMIAPLRLVTLDDIRRLNRTKAFGTPTQWAVVGVDNMTTGNPIVRVFPTPVTAQASANFNVAYFKKPDIVTTADTSVLTPFPSNMMTQGLLAFTLRDEERGNPSQQWQQEYAIFKQMLEETFNRYNGDMGSDSYFMPPRGRRGK